MDIEAARVFAEAFQGVGEGATTAFIVWIVFDFLKAAMWPVAWMFFFGWAYKPTFRFIKKVWEDV